MSRIVWSCVLAPPAEIAPETEAHVAYEGALRLPGLRRFPQADEQLLELPDPRSYRPLCRAALLLSAAGVQARAVLGPYLSRDPFRVGIYSAVEPGPNDYACARAMIDTPAAD